MQPYSALGLGLHIKDQENTLVNLIIHRYTNRSRFQLTGTIKRPANHAEYVLIRRPSTHWKARASRWICMYTQQASLGVEQPAGTASHMTTAQSLWAQPPPPNRTNHSPYHLSGSNTFSRNTRHRRIFIDTFPKSPFVRVVDFSKI